MQNVYNDLHSVTNIILDSILMNNIKLRICKTIGLFLCLLLSRFVFAFELLSESAMGSVSAVSANTAEEIVNVAGSSAAGLRVDDGYEVLPFKVSVQVGLSETDEVSTDLSFSLVQEVDSWVENLTQRNDIIESTNFEVGYVDELPLSVFDESAFVLRDEDFERLIIEPEHDRQIRQYEQETTIYEIGRIDQAITIIEQNVDSVEYIVERKLDFAATIDAFISDDSPSIGSGYISNLTSRSNVRIAAIRD